MWFDVRAALARIRAEPVDASRANPANCLESTSRNSRISSLRSFDVENADIAPADENSGNSRISVRSGDDPEAETARAIYLADRFEELAAILEYDEHLPRQEAERRARCAVYGD